MTAPVLRTTGLTRAWGAFLANDGIDFALEAGARHALIGPNGAGKTTFVNLLAGSLAPTRGDIEIAGETVTRLPPHARVRRGLARTFQINTLFPHLTPLESVTLAVAERTGAAWNAFIPWRSLAAERDEASAVLERVGIAGVRETPTRELAYGQQRLLEIALALAARPKVLLLDEPAAGVPRGEAGVLMEALEALPAETAVLFIEHDMALVFRYAKRITVLVGGRILMEGNPDEVAADARVREVYLGDDHG